MKVDIAIKKVQKIEDAMHKLHDGLGKMKVDDGVKDDIQWLLYEVQCKMQDVRYELYTDKFEFNK